MTKSIPKMCVQLSVFLTALSLTLLPLYSAHAATLLIGDKISIEADEVVEDDYYVSVGSLGSTVMSGKVEGDMYALGGSVTANGEVTGDFGAISGLTYMHASVTDDVRIIAGEAVIDDMVGDDVFVIAGSLKVLSTAEIKGDLIFYGVEAEINGPVGGSVYGSASKVRLDAPVKGSVDVAVSNELVLGSKAVVKGDVQYQSPRDLVRAQSAVVEGNVHEKPYLEPIADSDWRTLLIPLFVSLFATLTLYLLFKREIVLVVQKTLASPLPAGALGLAALIAGPLLSILLISTVLGMLLGFFGLGAVLVLATAGFALTNAFVGTLAARLLVNKEQVSLLWIILGAIIFHALLLLPVLGGIIAVALIAITIGGMLLTIYHHFR